MHYTQRKPHGLKGALRFMADLIGINLSSETKGTHNQDALVKLIEEGEKNFAEGKGVKLTLDELRDMTHHAA